MLLLGRGRMLAVVWLSGLLATYAALVVDLAAALEHGPDGGRRAYIARSSAHSAGARNWRSTT